MVSSVFLALFLRRKKRGKGGWKRGKVREREREGGEGGWLMIFELEESR